jgi:hypothetical protein
MAAKSIASVANTSFCMRIVSPVALRQLLCLVLGRLAQTSYPLSTPRLNLEQNEWRLTDDPGSRRDRERTLQLIYFIDSYDNALIPVSNGLRGLRARHVMERHPEAPV